MPRHVASARRRRSTQSPSSGLQGCPLLPLRRVVRAPLWRGRRRCLWRGRRRWLWRGRRRCLWRGRRRCGEGGAAVGREWRARDRRIHALRIQSFAAGCGAGAASLRARPADSSCDASAPALLPTYQPAGHPRLERPCGVLPKAAPRAFWGPWPQRRVTPRLPTPL